MTFLPPSPPPGSHIHLQPLFPSNQTKFQQQNKGGGYCTSEKRRK